MRTKIVSTISIVAILFAMLAMSVPSYSKAAGAQIPNICWDGTLSGETPDQYFQPGDTATVIVHTQSYFGGPAPHQFTLTVVITPPAGSGLPTQTLTKTVRLGGYQTRNLVATYDIPCFNSGGTWTALGTVAVDGTPCDYWNYKSSFNVNTNGFCF